MMKLASYIFSFYIVILSCMPCADIESSCQNANTIRQTEEQHSHIDICSPFCICACCGNQIAFQSVVVPAIPAVQFFQKENKTDFYKSRLISGFFGSIWQPPKLSAIL